MKDSEFKMKKLKHKVLSNKDPNKFWSLTKEEREYFESRGCLVEEALFRIRTKCLRNYHLCKNSTMKQLHQAKKRGKDYVTKRLRSEEVEFLRSEGYNLTPIKYRVIPIKLKKF